MIIEAGYDLFQLFAPKLFRNGAAKRKQGMWVIAMDKRLRMLYMTKVGSEFQPPEALIPKVAKALSRDQLGHVTYFAFARLDTALTGDRSAEFERHDEALRMAPELIGHELIGHFLSDGKGVYSSGPRYSFRDYLGMEHLPRPAIVLGPHDYPCECLACTMHQEMLNENWLRNHPATESAEGPSKS